MRSPWLALLLTLPLLSITACATDDDDQGDAANIGVIAEIDAMPEVTIDDEFGTEVEVSVAFTHMGGPDAETLEIVSASLARDLEPYADIALAIPADHPQFDGLLDGDDFEFQLRGSIPATHDDWGLCADPESLDADGQRVSLNLVMRVTPGANDDASEFEFESLAVTLHCTHTG
jgi:hypothetical protein